MAHLTIGALDVSVQESGAQRNENVDIGKRITRAFAGNARSSVRAFKKSWEFTTGPMSRAEVIALRALIDGGGFVNCTGEFLSGLIVSCSITINDEEYLLDATQPTSYQSVLRLRLEEV